MSRTGAGAWEKSAAVVGAAWAWAPAPPWEFLHRIMFRLFTGSSPLRWVRLRIEGGVGGPAVIRMAVGAGDISGFGPRGVGGRVPVFGRLVTPREGSYPVSVHDVASRSSNHSRAGDARNGPYRQDTPSRRYYPLRGDGPTATRDGNLLQNRAEL